MAKPHCRGQIFVFDGNAYQLATPAPGEHASHGYVHERPWQVIDSGASEGAWITSRFQSANFPEIDEPFPFPFEARVTYRLKDGVLCLEFEGVNVGDGDMPVGPGHPPVFSLAIDGKWRPRCVYRPHARRDVLALARRPDSNRGGFARDGTVYDVRKATPLKDRFYDNVWSGVQLTHGWSRCEYVDPTAEVLIAMEADDAFRELVLYAPDSRPLCALNPIPA